MEFVVFSVIIFIALFINAIKSKRVLFSFICLVYLISFFGTIVLNIFEKQDKILALPTFFFHIILLLWLLPFYKIKGFNKNEITFSKHLKLKRFIAIFGILGLLSLLYFSFFAIKLFLTYDLTSARNLISSESVLPLGFISLFFISFTTIYHIYIYMYFFTITYEYPKFYSNIMLLSSFSNAVMILCFFGRDGVLYWLMNFCVMYLYFKNVLNEKTSLNIKKMFLFFCVLGLVIFMLISISRFKDTSNGIYQSLVSYMGQQYQNFSDGFYLNSQSSSVIPTFSTLMQKLGLTKEVNLEIYTVKEQMIRGEEYNVFSFFIGSFISKIGIINTILISLIFCLILFNICNKYQKTKKVEYFFLLYMLFQIPLCGVFYYRQGVSYMDIGYLYTLVWFLFLKYRLKV